MRRVRSPVPLDDVVGFSPPLQPCVAHPRLTAAATDNFRPSYSVVKRIMCAIPPNAKLTDDEERAKDGRIETLDWPRSSSFGSGIR
jgi:hypothetical protein